MPMYLLVLSLSCYGNQEKCHSLVTFPNVYSVTETGAMERDVLVCKLFTYIARIIR